MFAPTYDLVKFTNDGKTLNIQFTYRDPDDIPEQFFMFCDHETVVSNCDSTELLESVYFDVTGYKPKLHKKYFHIGSNHYYRIYFA